MKLKNSLRKKIFIYIIGFAAIILAVLWLFQVAFLDDFYKMIKTKQVKGAAEEITKYISDDELYSYIDNIGKETDYCVQIYTGYGKKLTESGISNTENQNICGIDLSNPVERKAKMELLLQKAIDNNGEITETQENAFKNIAISDEDNYKFEGITVGRLISNDDGQSFFVVVNSRITPVNETVKTLQKQLLYISIFVFILTAIVAVVVANRIANPIRKINAQAKNLASGKKDIHFDGKGYIEIEELNDTLNYAVAELSKVETMRNELVANMSHDLRTPLTMIMGYGEAMRDIPEEKTPENIQVIIDEAQRMSDLVNNILDLSKLQAEIEELHITSFNLTGQIRSIIDRFMTLLEKDKYCLDFQYDKDVYVEADALKISQVIYNIMGNAIHYTGEDHRIMIRQIVENQEVTIEIEDTGKGIKEEDLPYVWDRYYKLKNKHTRQQIGTGLGLSIVRGVLELHKASYGVKSVVGKGAIFYFRLILQDKKE
ncbi:MAG: sensor histidine kinase [Breznakia sp.]